ncbi:hypothetical protein F889_01559 [Acinetobacter colistiniresistens]|uniref:Uncharacterized protein n=1 Tax=Acinetobacter colistiniresistens TaxID=280145 RepID=N9PMZ3_9GAMM|nr:hypothetical protein [Acinetobacter colistiniresistens]ENX34919.1 hypothetical protein F889_01559 [Acinetobacter colistiniresistens]
MHSITTQYPIFEWFKQDLTAKSPSYDAANVRTTSNEKPIDFQDRLGVVGALDTLFSKSLASLILFDGNSQNDYEYVRNHLAGIIMEAAQKDKRREPQKIAMYHLSWLMARMILDFALNPSLEENYTEKGRLFYAGIGPHQMRTGAYRMTWKPYEKVIKDLLLDETKAISLVMKEYKKNTLKAQKI